MSEANWEVAMGELGYILGFAAFLIFCIGIIIGWVACCKAYGFKEEKQHG